jgi:SAM-dependent methyltransferase
MPMTPNAEQKEFWAREGEEWVVQAARYDNMNREFGEAVLEAAALQPGERVLDVGCGNGAMSLDAARRVQPDGTILGIDISAPMLGLARTRASNAGITNAEFVQGDAQVHPFDAGGFDVMLSRFGVMFFEDPEAAFANLARAVRPDGRLTMVVWEDILKSEWIVIPGAAAAEHVGFPDFGPPGAPGPFALADRARLERILLGAGFSGVSLEAVTRPMRVADDVDDFQAFITSLELVRDQMFAGQPEDKVAAAIAAAREAIAPYAGPEGVVMNGTAWLVTARR